jgi:hypothetical protein
VRKIAPREFDVLYLHIILRYTLDEIARLLTDRAIRNNKPERYDTTGTTLLLLSGIDKVRQIW